MKWRHLEKKRLQKALPMPGFDNIDFVLAKTHCPGISFIDSIPQHLTIVSTEGINQFGAFITGYLGTLKVSISEKRVKIFDSSLCKYYLGDNFKTLTKGDTKLAIEQISDKLHLPLYLANITRIDFATNLIMQHEPKLYYQYLGQAQYYKRLEQNNGLYYTNHLRQIVFYNKVHEQKVKGKNIPELYKNRNVLRPELRFKGRLRQQFKKPEITASLLYNEVFYLDLIKRWEREYLAIEKIQSKLINMKPTGSTKQLIDHLALFQVIELGQSKILSIIKEWQSMGLITKKQASDHRTKIKELSKVKSKGQSNELIKELNQKVKEAARC